VICPHQQHGRRTRETKYRRRERVGWAFFFRGRRLQSNPATEAHGGARMRAPMNRKLVGRWRIVETDIWDRQYLDLRVRASIIIRANGRGEIAFGALQAGLDVKYSQASVGFTGKASTKWTRSPATDRPNCSTTVRSRSNLPIKTTTKPLSKPSGTLLQRPARSPLAMLRPA